MARRPCRNHNPAFKAKGALAAIKNEKTLVERAQQFDVHPMRVTDEVYQVGGPQLTAPDDAAIYLVR